MHLGLAYFRVLVFGLEGISCDCVSEIGGPVVLLFAVGVGELVFVG